MVGISLLQIAHGFTVVRKYKLFGFTVFRPVSLYARRQRRNITGMVTVLTNETKLR